MCVCVWGGGVIKALQRKFYITSVTLIIIAITFFYAISKPMKERKHFLGRGEITLNPRKSLIFSRFTNDICRRYMYIKPN